MQLNHIISAFFLSVCLHLDAQHTFSIVAVDTLTGEIGSAGATCLTSADCGGCGGAIIISEIVPGKGAVNAQATVCLPNANAVLVSGEIESGLSASEALISVLSNDQCQFGTTADRQYGIATFQNGVVDATSYTGESALNHAGHRIGVDYAIQGNILLGPEILDSMEARFIRADGESLANRLMEAMQGANVPGADSRCLADGLSSKSSFLRVAGPADPIDELTIDIKVENPEFDNDPIDILQTMVNLLSDIEDPNLSNSQVKLYPNPSSDQIKIELGDINGMDRYVISNSVFEHIISGDISQKTLKIDVSTLVPGIYFMNVYNQNTIVNTQKLLIQR